MGPSIGALLVERAEPAPLADFYEGRRAALAACYREYYRTVERAVGRILSGADQETVIHAVFLRLIQDRSFRESFTGGSMAAWLTTIARNQAIDFRRRYREEPTAPEDAEALADRPETDFAEKAEARMWVDRFRKEKLPPKWANVFEARFIQQLDQRTAAASLNMHRTTLAY